MLVALKERTNFEQYVFIWFSLALSKVNKYVDMFNLTALFVEHSTREQFMRDTNTFI
jgi:hypothetical protein